MRCRAGLACVLAGVLLCTAGCFNRGPSRIKPPGIDASSAGSGAMQQYDANSDGMVKGDELAKAPSLAAALKNLDTSGDGSVSADEVSARVRSWQDSKVGVMSLQLKVLRGNQAVKGAKVRLVPETFLGSEIQPCEGTADDYGVCTLNCPPGLYRVEITAADGSIGPKYNTETTLGQEVAIDAAGLQEGIKFQVE